MTVTTAQLPIERTVVDRQNLNAIYFAAFYEDRDTVDEERKRVYRLRVKDSSEIILARVVDCHDIPLDVIEQLWKLTAWNIYDMDNQSFVDMVVRGETAEVTSRTNLAKIAGLDTPQKCREFIKSILESGRLIGREKKLALFIFKRI